MSKRDKRRWWKRPEFAGKIASRLVLLLGGTMRLRKVNPERFEGLSGGRILCGWHGRSLMAAHHYRRKGWWVIISLSNDGDIQTDIFRRLGYEVIRGSTGRGGARALIEAIRVLKEGGSMALTPDGPRGPSGVVQEGIVAMARKSGCALVPIGLTARPRWLVNAWDRYQVPWPFARGVMVFGEPQYVAPDADEAAVEAARERLEQAIHACQAESERLLYGDRGQVEPFPPPVKKKR